MSETNNAEGHEQAYMPNWSTTDVLNYESERAQQERRVQTEQATLRGIDKRAKDRGLPVEVIKAVIRLRKRDPAEAEIYVAQFMRISAANGIVGPQLQMFSQSDYEPTSEEARIVRVANAEDAGFKAGRGGLDKDSNPYEVGSEESAAWIRWWTNGVAAAKFANGGVAPSPATKKQPNARGRRPTQVRVLSPPEEQAMDMAPPISEPEPAPVKRRGRPPKVRSNGQTPPTKAAAPSNNKRGPGRPKGSLNKPKTTNQPSA